VVERNEGRRGGRRQQLKRAEGLKLLEAINLREAQAARARDDARKADLAVERAKGVEQGPGGHLKPLRRIERDGRRLAKKRKGGELPKHLTAPLVNLLGSQRAPSSLELLPKRRFA
jgi:hypothetical protein